MEPIDRFLAKVEQTPLCWQWLGACHGTREPRGHFWNGEKNVDAARWIYQHHHPDADLTGKVIRHTCDNPLCVKPAHLLVGTQADNVADMHARGRSHHQTDPAVNKRAMAAANATMRAEPHRRQRGERHWCSKLSDGQRAEIAVSTERTAILADRYGVDRTQIQRIRRAALKARAAKGSAPK